MTSNHYWHSSSSRVFFQSACDVPEPEEKFNIDEYSDMVTLSKPIIYISIEEIINTHSVKPAQWLSYLDQIFAIPDSWNITPLEHAVSHTYTNQSHSVNIGFILNLYS